MHTYNFLKYFSQKRKKHFLKYLKRGSGKYTKYRQPRSCMFDSKMPRTNIQPKPICNQMNHTDLLKRLGGFAFRMYIYILTMLCVWEISDSGTFSRTL